MDAAIIEHRTAGITTVARSISSSLAEHGDGGVFADAILGSIRDLYASTAGSDIKESPDALAVHVAGMLVSFGRLAAATDLLRQSVPRCPAAAIRSWLSCGAMSVLWLRCLRRGLVTVRTGTVFAPSGFTVVIDAARLDNDSSDPGLELALLPALDRLLFAVKPLFDDCSGRGAVVLASGTAARGCRWPAHAVAHARARLESYRRAGGWAREATVMASGHCP